MDRSASGLSDFTQYFTGRTTAPMKTTDGRVTLRVYVDSSSVEAFGADGQTAVTSLIFPGPDADGMAFYAKGGTAHIDSLKVHMLDSTCRLVDRVKPLVAAPTGGEFRSDLGNLTITLSAAGRRTARAAPEASTRTPTRSRPARRRTSTSPPWSGSAAPTRTRAVPSPSSGAPPPTAPTPTASTSTPTCA